MKTLYISLDAQNIDFNQLELAKQFILDNQCVAIPTETVYGLAANAWSEEAIAHIFKAKGRPSDNPLIVHVSNEEMLLKCIDQEITPAIRQLMDAFWPGPLTLVFKKSYLIPDVVSASLPTVGIRMPNHAIAMALIEATQLPLAAPSANISGRPSPTKASHVKEDLDGLIAAIIEADQSEVGVESTVLDVSSSPFMVLRKGGISIEDLHTIDATIQYDHALVDASSTPKSPGQKYKHYAPRKPMTLLEGTIDQQLAYLKTISLENTLLISVDVIVNEIEATWKFSLGAYAEHKKALNNLFTILRDSEFMPVSYIMITSFEEHGLGATLNDRIRKASSKIYHLNL